MTQSRAPLRFDVRDPVPSPVQAGTGRARMSGLPRGGGRARPSPHRAAPRVRRSTSTIGRRTSALSISPVRASQYLAGAGLGSANSSRVSSEMPSQRASAASRSPCFSSVRTDANASVSRCADSRMAPSAPSVSAS